MSPKSVYWPILISRITTLEVAGATISNKSYAAWQAMPSTVQA
jgi:hypothetical protein